MADITVVRTDDEQAFIEKTLGSSWVDAQSFENWRTAAVVAANRKALLRILREYDQLCEEVGVRYFLFAETLKGVVSYGDFLPGKDAVLVGMMRTDYKKLARAYQKLEKESGGAPFSFWQIDEYDDVSRRVLRRFPRLKTNAPVPVVFGGDPVFDDCSLPIETSPYIEVSIFDEVPDDFFMRKKFYRQMKRRNRLFGRAMRAREMFFGRPCDDDPVESEPLKSVLRAVPYLFVPLRFSSWSLRKKAQKYEGWNTKCVARVMGPRSKTILASDLGKCTRRSFAGMMARCPDRPDVWAMVPVMETTPELKRLQDDAKEIVKEIDRVCSVLGIKYFCCGGTMLGYVRHGGFIPWDDDIDIGMLREDYEVFKKKAAGVIDADRFFVQTRESDPNIPYLFSKVRMNGTEYLTEYNKDRDFHKGICVDVFPFDYIPNGRSGQETFARRMKRLARDHHRIVNRQYPEVFKKSTEGYRNVDWLIAQVVGRILAKYYWSKSLDETQEAYDEAASSYNASAKEKGLKYVACFIPSYTMIKVQGDMLPLQRVDFDGIEVNLPARPEVFLRMQYGDYMVLPYPHQRAGHDLLLWSDEEGVGGGRLADG